MAVPFKEKIETLVQLFKEPKVLNSILSSRHSGYFIDEGWFNAFKLKKPVDAKSNPIPWLTYPFIEFIKNRLNKDLSLLEFGCGNSTLYFANKTGFVTSIEHNEYWYKELRNKIPYNVKLIFSKTDSLIDYINPLKNSRNKFDIILIDGIHRVECCLEATKFLPSSGIIVLDDSERIEYLPGVEQLRQNGFKELPFWGISPGNLHKKATTIFYRTHNCLNI